MATTKTLTPTNQNITLAAFTEKPDNRINVANDEKLADAVNVLNGKFTSDYPVKSKMTSYGTHSSFTIGNVAQNESFLIFGASGVVAPFCYLISVGAGTATVVNKIVDPYNITITATVSNGVLTIEFSPSVSCILKCVGLH